MTGEKIRFRFRKADALRLISHLDTMRCFERMLRRASVPFDPRPAFTHPLDSSLLCLCRLASSVIAKLPNSN